MYLLDIIFLLLFSIHFPGERDFGGSSQNCTFTYLDITHHERVMNPCSVVQGLAAALSERLVTEGLTNCQPALE